MEGQTEGNRSLLLLVLALSGFFELLLFVYLLLTFLLRYIDFLVTTLVESRNNNVVIFQTKKNIKFKEGWTVWV